MEDLEAVVGGHVEAAGSLQAAIAAFVAARVTYFQEHQDFFRLYVDEIGSQVRTPRQRQTLCGAMIDRQTRLLERLISAAVDRREIRDVDPAATALALFDITRGLVARHLFSQERSDTARDVRCGRSISASSGVASSSSRARTDPGRRRCCASSPASPRRRAASSTSTPTAAPSGTSATSRCSTAI